MGGLPKKAQYLIGLREKKEGVLALDSGALLFKEEKVKPDQRPQLTATAQGIVSAYNRMSFAAVGVARQDLAAGLDFLLTIQQKSRFPWLSANLVSRTQGKPYFKPHTMLTAAGMKIAVIGLTGGQNPENLLTAKDNAVILPWEEVLPREIALLKGQADMLILLSSLQPVANREIAAKHPEIHLILQSGNTSSNLPPELSNNTLITQVEQQGKTVGILDVRWNKQSKKWEDQNRENMLLTKKNELDRLSWQINRYRRKGEPQLVFKDQPEALATYESLLAQRKSLDQEISRLLIEKEASKAKQQGDSSFSHRFEALRKELPDNPEVRAIVEATTSEVNRIGKLAAQARSKTGADNGRKFYPDNYAGSAACKSCHPAPFKKWSETRHAFAYDTLVSKGQQFNNKCLPCHVTGAFGQSGDTTLMLAEDFRQVGCENCHGPADRHVAQPQSAKPSQPTRDVCIRCHTGDHDGSFIFSEALGRLRCGNR